MKGDVVRKFLIESVFEKIIKTMEKNGIEKPFKGMTKMPSLGLKHLLCKTFKVWFSPISCTILLPTLVEYKLKYKTNKGNIFMLHCTVHESREPLVCDLT